MKRVLAVLFTLLFFVIPQTGYAKNLLEAEVCVEDKDVSVSDIFFGGAPEYKTNEQVYLCGLPVGITIDGDGVTVIGLNEFVSNEGVVSPAGKGGLLIGDVITHVDGNKINNVSVLSEHANKSHGQPLSLRVLRESVVIEIKITPKIDVLNGTYKIGVWAKDSSSGIGTLTYIRQNMQFGALGHPIVDTRTGEPVTLISGSLYPATINDVVSGAKGSAGELKGTFDFNDKIGTLYINNKYGVYGNITKLPDNFSYRLYSVANPYQIRPGKAQILTTISGNTPELYDIEIIKVYGQNAVSDKGLVIRVVDQRLIDVTGGIVQGMSGSPIIQNGMFVGAVTHVFVNDPTKGYGIIAQWMLEN